MRGSAAAVDDLHTMTSTLLPPEHLLPTATASGRFARQLRTIACADPEMAPARSSTVARMRERLQTSEFRIDPRLVSGAIMERMSAGHAL